MSNHVSHAALPYPIKGARFTLPVPYLDADGDPTDPTTPDTEISKDGAAFSDCTEEVSTISGSNGAGYLTITGDENNCSLVFLAAKVASGPKATLASYSPRVLALVTTGTAQSGAAGSITLASGAPSFDLSGFIVKTTGGTGGAGGSGSRDNQARVITAYDTTTKAATVSPSWETTPDATTTYEILASESGPVNIASLADFKTQVDTALADIHLDHLIAVADPGSVVANSSFLAKLVSKSATPAFTSYNNQTDSLEAQADLTGSTFTAIPWNAAWDAEVQSEVQDALVVNGLDKIVSASGTSDSGTTTTMVDAARTESNSDYWKGSIIVFTSGTIAGQARIITDFNATTDTITFAPATTAAVSTQTYVILPHISVWEDTTAEHLSSGSTGNALNAAGSAGDPWSTVLPGAYGASTAGKLIGDNINATVSSRASQTSVDTIDDFVDTEVAAILAAVDTEVAAIKAKTDNLPATPASSSDVPTANANADALLDRTSAIETGVTLRGALRIIAAACAGKASGLATTTAVYRNAVADSKARITATVDEDGNRTAVTTDLT